MKNNIFANPKEYEIYCKYAEKNTWLNVDYTIKNIPVIDYRQAEGVIKTIDYQVFKINTLFSEFWQTMKKQIKNTFLK